MTKKTATTTTVELTEAQRNIVLNALYDKLLDSRRYLSGSEVDDEPGPLDSCCDAHLARYEQRRENFIALKRQKSAIDTTLALFLPAKDLDDHNQQRTNPQRDE